MFSKWKSREIEIISYIWLGDSTLRFIIRKPTKMLNSIVLSSDMETLYLIDNGRALEFPLGERGLLIGILDGQLSVATAMKIPVPITDDEPDSPEIPTRPKSEAKLTRQAIQPAPKDPLFPVNLKVEVQKSQWALSFNPQQGNLYAIGATDIDFDRPDLPVKPLVHIFALRKGVLRLTKRDKILYFNFLEKG